jgi:hypothetical protein
VAETTVKTLLCGGVRCTVKVTGQVYRCWWRICWETNVFPRSEYHMFYILYPFVAYLMTLPYITCLMQLELCCYLHQRDKEWSNGDEGEASSSLHSCTTLLQLYSS